jgi:HSP20 family protein
MEEFLYGSGSRELMTIADWAPTVDVSETDDEYLIKVELPEVRKEDVKVTIHDGVLTLQGERKLEREEKNKKYHRVERAYGSFARSFTLPDNVDDNSVKARNRDGMLYLHLGKTEEAKPKSIEVNVA